MARSASSTSSVALRFFELFTAVNEAEVLAALPESCGLAPVEALLDCEVVRGAELVIELFPDF